MEDEPEPAVGAANSENSANSLGDLGQDLYAAAAECISAVINRRASVKSAIFKSPFEDKRRLLAVTQKTMDNLPQIKKLIYDAKVLKESGLTKAMAYVLVYDLVFGKLSVRNGISRLIVPYIKDIRAAAKKHENNIKNEKDSSSTSIVPLRDTSITTPRYPRYVRVNTLKTTLEEVISELEKEGFALQKYDESKLSQKGFIKMIRRYRPKDFFRDFHIPDLLVFHPSVSFHQHPLETSGKIILQDKSSCLASFLLNPSPNSNVIDACAAPGMKTSHLAALMENQGKILAVDMNEARCEIMKNMLQLHGTKCTDVLNKDFLEVDPEDPDFATVSHILVDPTCTGSGVTARTAQFAGKKEKRRTKEDRQRLQKLKNLQTSLLKHALRFPGVQRVVYSTCSMNPEEDEEVVQEAMKHFQASFIVKPFRKYLPSWKGCGKPRYSVGPLCLRAFPEKHRTNGFFIAIIERAGLDDGTEKNDFENIPKTISSSLDAVADDKTSSEKPVKRKHSRKRPKLVAEHWSIEMESSLNSTSLSANDSAVTDNGSGLENEKLKEQLLKKKLKNHKRRQNKKAKKLKTS